MRNITTRRGLLRGGIALGAASAATGLPGLGGLASAASGTGYKALVCINLSGGMDAYDSVVPTDATPYAVWARSRQRLLNVYEGAGDDSRLRDKLVTLGRDASGVTHGLPRQLAPLAALYRTGALAVVANQGVLVEPTTRAMTQDKRARLPRRLMSHNDQSAMWATGGAEGEAMGFGGRMIDALAAASPLSSICFSANPAFLAGESSKPFRLSSDRVRRVDGLSARGGDVLREHLTAGAAHLDSLFASDLQAMQRQAVELTEQLDATVGVTTEGDAVVMPGNGLSEQLCMVAKMISQRGALGVSRQVFYLSLNGFDTHDDQIDRLPELQGELADALAAFYQETVRQGVADSVTTFTASEFGRTLTPNNAGTDHGWGGHQFVMGGAVRGGQIFGEVPPAELGHDQDLGRGRMIPTIANEQVVASLGRWLGVSDGDLAAMLPNAGRFGAPLALF